ncbi:MAG: patatin-like phospholipase family protein, partial [Gammaproteobacteria bacterium]|nr:patatin-like phospholipase family protein [Gammaproteobacteria bacterium]
MPENEKKPFTGRLDRLALSLSGGGVRAIGFHLGTMSMLERLGLLEKVQILSTVSGGSMPGMGYSLSQALGRPFQDFFDDFYEFLPQLNVIEEMMTRVVGREPPAPSGRRDLITAMANIYEEFYFGRFFGQYAEDGPLTFDILMREPRGGHLEEIIFNATEFKTGTAFRFQVSAYRCLIGNRNIALCHRHARMIRLADIMAASSCIPVGMEPLFFPDDFHWPDDPRWRRLRRRQPRPTCSEIQDALSRNQDTGLPNFALMDGGVYDNQGVTSTLNALNRRKEGIRQADSPECGFALSGRGDPPGPKEWANWMSGRVVEGAEHRTVDVDSSDLDLLIISDTPVRKASLYPRVSLTEEGIPEPTGRLARHARRANSWFGRITLGQLSKVATVMLVMLFVSAAITTWDLFHGLAAEGEGTLLGFKTFVAIHLVLPIVLVVLTAIGLILVKVNKAHAIEALQRIIPHWKKKPGKYIDKVRLGDLLQMGLLRGGSVSTLTSTIYMNRIRGLGYAVAYSREDLKNRVLDNEIYTLQASSFPDNDFHRRLAADEAWPPPAEMGRIVGHAATMPTKLWLEQHEGDPLNDLDYLVVCGQATICYNLMKHAWDECRRDGEWLDPGTEELFEHALAEWKKLVRDPLSLLIDRKRR